MDGEDFASRLARFRADIETELRQCDMACTSGQARAGALLWARDRVDVLVDGLQCAAVLAWATGAVLQAVGD